MSGLQAIGAIAQGFGQGLERGQLIRERNMRMEQTQREQDQQAALQADMQAADAAAAAEARRIQEEAAQQQRGLGAYLTRGGSDGSLAGGDVAQDAVSQPVQPFQPTKRHMLAVSEARVNELLKRGRMEPAMKLWMQDEGMRAQLRAEAAQRGLQRFKVTGDPEPLLKEVYGNIDDNWDIANVIRGPETQDGVAIFGVERVNKVTGEKRVDEVRSDEIEDAVMSSIDPKNSAEYAWRSKLESLRGRENRKTNLAQHGHRMAEIGARGANALDQIEARNEAVLDGKRIQVDGAIAVAKIRAAARGGGGGGKGGGGSAASEYYAPRIAADGTLVAVHKKTGIGKVVTTDDGNPVRGIEAEKLLASMTRDIGKTIEGQMNGYGANRETARGLTPKPPTAPAKAPLSSFDKTRPAASGPRPGLDSYMVK